MSSGTTEVIEPREGSRHVLLARLLLGFTLGGVVVGIVIGQIDARATGTSWTEPFSDLLFFIGFLAFPLTGYVLATRRPDNSLGWLLLGIGVAIGLGSITSSYGAYAMHGGPGGPELGADPGGPRRSDVAPAPGADAHLPPTALPRRTPSLAPMAVVRA